MRQVPGNCLSTHEGRFGCIEVIRVMKMKKRWRTDACLVLCGVLVWFLADAERIRTAAEEALTLCANAVIPALYPFMVVSGLLISLGFGEWISPHFAGFMTLFSLPGTASTALLLGLAGGYPVGARTAVNLYEKKLLTTAEAERLLAFCNNSNPVFLISVLGSGLFGSVRTGVWLWLIHVLSALLTGLCVRGTNPKTRQSPPRFSNGPQEISFAAAFVKAVQGAAMSMVPICGFIVFFYILASPLSGLEAPAGPFLVGLLELFSLTPLLSANRLGFVIASACAGFGGISILCQTASVLDGSGLRLRPYVCGKILQGIFSFVLAFAVSFYVL